MNAEDRRSLLDLAIEDDSSTEDEWSFDSNHQNEEMNAHVLLDFALLPEDLTWRDGLFLFTIKHGTEL
jgi:hypothetical protein